MVQGLELLSCVIQCLGGSGWSRECLEGLKVWPFLFCLSWLPNSGYLGSFRNLSRCYPTLQTSWLEWNPFFNLQPPDFKKDALRKTAGSLSFTCFLDSCAEVFPFCRVTNKVPDASMFYPDLNQIKISHCSSSMKLLWNLQVHGNHPFRHCLKT